jgi:hypothetical protein
MSGDQQGNSSQAQFNNPFGITWFQGGLVRSCSVAARSAACLPVSEGACATACVCLQLVCDADNNRIKSFSPTIQFVTDVGGNGSAGQSCISISWALL